MKGLLRKDLYMMWAYCRSFLLIVAVFLIVPLFSEDMGFFVIYPMLVGIMLPTSLIGYDEKFRWDRCCDALPVTRAQAVSVKYLLTLLTVAAVFVLTVSVQLLAGRASALPERIPMLLGVGFIAPSLLMPVIFWLGIEKGRIAYYVAVGLVTAAAMLTSDEPFPLHWGRPGSGLLLPALSLGFFAASWLLSIALYQRREL